MKRVLMIVALTAVSLWAEKVQKAPAGAGKESYGVLELVSKGNTMYDLGEYAAAVALYQDAFGRRAKTEEEREVLAAAYLRAANLLMTGAHDVKKDEATARNYYHMVLKSPEATPAQKIFIVDDESEEFPSRASGRQQRPVKEVTPFDGSTTSLFEAMDL